ncbi:MAB_1171c family putative transporter [Streptomyces sp. NPDC089919]|uniref:MAB_1171c family putative transporter n=1 Tax=Streptomyces sp. NPDC089919 TaxID=3155188 RepID=UPI00341AD040
MDGTPFYVPAAVLVIAFACKVPGLLRDWRDPLVRAVSILLLVASLVFVFAAPPTIHVVNAAIGIPNVSAPLVYCVLSAFSASCLLLLISWRGGEPERTRLVSRWCLAAYCVVISALIILFSLADAPVERLRDLDTYYANTPYMREMITLYLAAHTTAAVIMTVLCRRWSLRVGGWLRSGLKLMVAGFLLNLLFDAAKFTAIIARWTGHDLDYLSTDVAPPIAQVSALLIGVGFVIPLVAVRIQEHWQAWAMYRALGPLWRELRAATPRPPTPVHISWWSPADLRVTHRIADIRDGILHLNPYFDQDLRARAHAAAVGAGAGVQDAEATAEAAMVAAAINARAADPDERVIGSTDAYTAPRSDGQRDLVLISRLLRCSPIVEDARRRTASTESDHR